MKCENIYRLFYNKIKEDEATIYINILEFRPDKKNVFCEIRKGNLVTCNKISKRWQNINFK